MSVSKILGSIASAGKSAARATKSKWLGNLFKDPIAFGKVVSGHNRRLYDAGGRTGSTYAARATSMRSNRFLYSRLLPAAGLYAGGQIGAYNIGIKAQEQRAYLGDAEYEARYGNSAQTAANIVSGATSGLAIGRLIGIKPTSLLKPYFRSVGTSIDKSTKYAMDALKNTSGSRVGNFARSMGHTAAGVAKLSPLLLPIAAYGAAAHPGIATAAALGSVVAADVATLAISKKYRNFISRNKGIIGGGLAVGGAGVAVGMNKNIYPAAEGNIEDVGYGSATQKLNYSTAGLSQSLHRRRHG